MWSQTACRNPVMICLSTIEKFQQRIPLGYQPRVPSFPYHIQYYKSSNIYHYYDFCITRRNEFEHLKKYIKDGDHLRLLNRMNSHDRFAAVLYSAKFDDWLIKVRVVDEKKSIKICTKPEATNSTENLDHIDIRP